MKRMENARAKRNHTIVSGGTCWEITFSTMARNPHKNAVTEAKRIPLMVFFDKPIFTFRV
jgi:hypothetical protein